MKKEDKGNEVNGLKIGVLSALVPHIGCIAFVVLTILGLTTASVFFKKFLISKVAFYMMIIFSFFLVGISSFFYLKKNCCINKKKYLLTLFSSIIFINLLFYFIIFPATANISAGPIKDIKDTKLISLQVEIPCPGHAPLITNELKKIPEIKSVKYRTPNYFDIECDENLEENRILEAEIFKEFSAEII